jgi:hypothetical protein
VRGVIQLYDAQSLRLFKTLIYPRAHSIQDVAFTADGRGLLAFGDLASSGSPGTVLWNLDSGAPVGAPFGPMTPLTGRILADGDSVAILTGSSGSVEVWSVSRRQLVRVLPDPGAVRTMTVASDGRTTVLGGQSETVLADGLSGAVQRRVPVPLGRTVSPDGATLLVATGSDVAVWDIASATQRGLARQHTGAVLTVTWSTDGRTFASTSDDRSTIVWDGATLRPLDVFTGPAGRQVSVGFSGDGRSLVTAGQDGCVYLWDLTGRRRGETQLDPAGPYAGGRIDPQNASAVLTRRAPGGRSQGALAYGRRRMASRPVRRSSSVRPFINGRISMPTAPAWPWGPPTAAAGSGTSIADGCCSTCRSPSRTIGPSGHTSVLAFRATVERWHSRPTSCRRRTVRRSASLTWTAARDSDQRGTWRPPSTGSGPAPTGDTSSRPRRRVSPRSGTSARTGRCPAAAAGARQRDAGPGSPDGRHSPSATAQDDRRGGGCGLVAGLVAETDNGYDVAVSFPGRDDPRQLSRIRRSLVRRHDR